MSKGTVQLRLDPLERALWERLAERRGTNLSELIRGAVRKELSVPDGRRLVASVSHERVVSLYDRAAELGITSDQLIEAVLRDHLAEVSEDDLDRSARRTRAQRRAKELLNQ